VVAEEDDRPRIGERHVGADQLVPERRRHWRHVLVGEAQVDRDECRVARRYRGDAGAVGLADVGGDDLLGQRHRPQLGRDSGRRHGTLQAREVVRKQSAAPHNLGADRVASRCERVERQWPAVAQSRSEAEVGRDQHAEVDAVGVVDRFAALGEHDLDAGRELSVRRRLARRPLASSPPGDRRDESAIAHRARRDRELAAGAHPGVRELGERAVEVVADARGRDLVGREVVAQRQVAGRVEVVTSSCARMRPHHRPGRGRGRQAGPPPAAARPPPAPPRRHGTASVARRCRVSVRCGDARRISVRAARAADRPGGAAARHVAAARARPPERAARFARVAELPAYLATGDLLLVNDVRVIPARLRARREDSKPAELLLVRPAGGTRWEALARPARRLRPGVALALREGRAIPLEPLGEGRWLIDFDPPLDASRLERAGEAPLPPYIRREHGPTPADRLRYQTVYAAAGRAVAAPTAGLHFTPELLAAIDERGVERASITLHVGPGTFRPVQADDPREHRLDVEDYECRPRPPSR
jgi:hypothetical protein